MKRWQFWLGIAISALFLWWAGRGLEFGEALHAVREANYWWILPGVGAYMVGLFIRAWRWHYLLRPIKNIPVRKMFPIVTIGYMGNNIYPFRIGEVLRAFLLRRKEDVAVSASLATIIVERIFDGVVMLGFIFFNLSELGRLGGDSGFIGNIRQVALYGTLAFGGALVAFLLTAMFPSMARAVYTPIINLLPKALGEKILNIIDKFMDGLACLRSPKDALMIFFTSIIIWLLETAKYWFVMHAFNFSVSFFALMLMNGIVNLATTIPSAPGYVGTFDGPGIAVLTAYGVPHAVATAYTLVLHIALWVPPTILGLYFFAREGLSWSEVKAWQESDDLLQETAPLSQPN